jgi:translation initiation factor IF-2
VTQLNYITGDVAGSVEAITDTLATFQSNLCDIEILHSGVGDVTPYDIELAELFDGMFS